MSSYDHMEKRQKKANLPTFIIFSYQLSFCLSFGCLFFLVARQLKEQKINIPNQDSEHSDNMIN